MIHSIASLQADLKMLDAKDKLSVLAAVAGTIHA
jgi:hypothetical protein